jgi:hypothetical protein
MATTPRDKPDTGKQRITSAADDGGVSSVCADALLELVIALDNEKVRYEATDADGNTAASHQSLSKLYKEASDHRHRPPRPVGYYRRRVQRRDGCSPRRRVRLKLGVGICRVHELTDASTPRGFV